MRLNTELMERSAARDAVIAQLGYTKPGFKWAPLNPVVRIERYVRGKIKEVLEVTIEQARNVSRPAWVSAIKSGAGAEKSHREHIMTDDNRGQG